MRWLIICSKVGLARYNIVSLAVDYSPALAPHDMMQVSIWVVAATAPIASEPYKKSLSSVALG
jgi:hypothetical protein